MNLDGYAMIDRVQIPFKFSADPDKSLVENVNAWQTFAQETILARLKADPNWLTIHIRFGGDARHEDL